MSEYSAIIIGSGPAGLAAMSALGERDCLVIEAGQPFEQREWSDEHRAGEGVGGAGLFSDGKFSYYPSATQLWRLDGGRLTPAYAWLLHRLEEVGISAPPEWHPSQLKQVSGVAFKDYPSVYASVGQRNTLISGLAAEGEIRANERVVAIRRERQRWRIETTRGTYTSRHAILAMGRFGALGPFKENWTRYRRIEVGVRIVQDADAFFLRSHPSLDPKLILRDDGGRFEWRTFCCCRNGTTITTRTAGLTAISGRADGPSTGYSNVGFNVRILEQCAPAEAGTLIERLGSGSQLRCSLDLGIADAEVLNQVFGPAVSTALREGLRLLRGYDSLGWLEDARLVGPTIEGVGYYPDHNSALGCEGHAGLWVAGDMSGSFRGLVAALVSGRLVGQAVRERIDSE